MVAALAEVLQAAIAMVLAIAALAKLTDLNRFVSAVAGYGIVPPIASRPVAMGLIGWELALAIWLWLDMNGTLAPIASAVTFGLFAVAATIALRTKGPIECGCIGSRRELSRGTIFGAAALAIVSVLSLVAGHAGEITPNDRVALVAAGVLLGATYLLSMKAAEVIAVVRKEGPA